MAPRKLSDSDKGDIIELYKQPSQTTSTLAKQYGVSNSTISRILKTTLPPDEYSQLIAKKRLAGTDKAVAESVEQPSQVQPSQEQPSVAADRQKIDPPKLKTADEKEEARKTKSSRRRSSSRRHHTEEDEQLALLEGPQAIETHQDASNVEPMVLAGDIPGPVVTGAVDIMAADDDEDSDDDDDDDLIGLDETLGDDFGDDDEDDDEDDEDDDDDDDEDLVALPKPKLQSAMAIMPLTEAVLPKPSYLVVDMRSELITRPLSEFADLGQIPTSEEKAKTLPVFDNHRVARRFSRNKQRVIKVPDGSLITRTSPYLTAKGITRLLVDGQVFDLASSD